MLDYTDNIKHRQTYKQYLIEIRDIRKRNFFFFFQSMLQSFVNLID